MNVSPLLGAATPERPGPGALPLDLLRALQIEVARRLAGMVAGDYRSSLYGDGVELAQLRPYEAGDDVRKMEWNVTARTGIPHVRVHLAERVLVTWLVLDTSPSMQFGTADRRKADVADGVAIATGHIATRRGNRLGVATFGDLSPATLPPAQGRAGLIGLLAALKREPSRHEVLAVEIRDPREQELPDVGELWLVDPETGREVRVDTRSATLRERFAAAAAEERSGVARVLTALGVRQLVLSTSGDWLRPYAEFLGAPR